MNVKKYERTETCEAVQITTDNVADVVKLTDGLTDHQCRVVQYFNKTGYYHAFIGDYLLKVTDYKGEYFTHCAPDEFHKLWKEVETPQGIDVGDTVYVETTNSLWQVGMVKDGRVYHRLPPLKSAELDKCRLMKKANDSWREFVLNNMTRLDGELGAYARERLEQK